MQKASQNSFSSVRRRLSVKQSIRVVFALCLGSIAASSLAAPKKNLSITALPLFDRSTTGPYLVDVENFGPDAVGEVTFSDGSFTFHYPIELPKGSSKEFSAYVPVGSQYGSYQVDLSTNHGGDSSEVRQMELERQILLISDQPGDLGFLRKTIITAKSAKRKPPNVDQVPVADCYVKPDLAPDRLAGYDLVHTVVLGEGAERLSTEKIEALKTFVLRGGNLVFNGGASAPFLRDTRWASLLPGTNYGSVQANTHLTTALRDNFDLSSFEQRGSLVDGAKTKNGFDYLYAGLGKVVVLHFNFFDKRLRDWDGRRSYLLEAQSNAVGTHFDPRVWQTNLYDEMGTYGYSTVTYSPGTPGATSYPGRPAEPTSDNPFSFKPPAPEIILTILGVYAVIVGPINFFVLRKMNKPDLAWVTCPAISLVAALLVLRLAGELYKNQEATATTGILFTRAEDPNGLFNGQTQMFFPNFGTYNLGLKNVDQVIPDPTYSYGYSSKSKTSFDFYDNGQLQVPQFQSHSLEFAQLHYRQEVPAGGWIQFDTIPSDEANTATIKITNNSPYAFINGRLCMEGVSEKIDKLDPGKSTTIAEEINSSLPDPEQDNNQTWENYSYLTKHPVFVANPVGFRPGPIVGSDVPALAGLEFVTVARQTTSASHL